MNLFDDFLQEAITDIDQFEEKQVEDIKLKEGEKRTVAILFADLKGFTALSEKLDSEEVHKLVNTLLKVFTFTIKKYDGYVDKYEGDLVMALFGAKKASELDTKKAICCGIEMLEQIKRFNNYLANNKQFNKLNIDLGLRIGINTGSVIAGKVGAEREGDFTVYGDAVNVASRMESNAPLNRIMVNHSTMKMVENAFIFDNRGEIEVKGKSKPIKVYVVKSRYELFHPEFSDKVYIGREKEKSVLIHSYKQYIKNIANPKALNNIECIQISGEAGIGKTRFLFEFIHGHVINKVNESIYLHGIATNLFKTPYYLFINLLRRYMNILTTDSVAIISSKFESSINLLYEQLEDNYKEKLDNSKVILGFLLGIQSNDPRLSLKGKEIQTHIHIAISVFFECVYNFACSQRKPIVIIFEDLQWNDENSHEALYNLFKVLQVNEYNNEKKQGIFFVLLNRSNYHFTEDVKSLCTIKNIDLSPLTQDEANLLIGSMLKGIEIPEHINKLLLEKSAGNPFYISEWISMVNNDKYIDYSRKRFYKHIEIPIPNNLTSLVLSRIDKLEKTQRILLQKASVIGSNFTHNMLVKLQRSLKEEIEIEESIKNIIHLDLIQLNKENDQVEYRFAHKIIQDVAYNTLLDYNKKILHRLVGNIIEEIHVQDLYNFYYHLADHYNQSDDEEKAIEYLNMAGSKAKDEYANDRAIEIFKKLIAKIPENSHQKLKSEVLIKRGNILEYIRKIERAHLSYLEALEIAESIDETELVAWANHYIGWNFYLQSEYAEAKQYLTKSIKLWEKCNNKKGLVKSKGNLGIVLRYEGTKNNDTQKVNDGIKIIQEQLLISEEIDSKADILAALKELAVYNDNNIRNFKEALKYYKEALEIANVIGDIGKKAAITTNMGILYYNMKDFDTAIKLFMQAVDVLQRTGDIEQLFNSYVGIAFCFYELTEKSKSKAFISKALKITSKIRFITNQFNLFQAKALLLRINIEENGNKKFLDGLIELIAEVKHEELKCVMQYDLWKSLKISKFSKTETESYRTNALKQFYQLYDKVPAKEYKKIIADLEAG